MRIRRIAGALGATLALTALAVVPAVQASASTAPLTLSCDSSNGFLLNGTYNRVDHYYSAGNVFTSPSSGHQSFCLHNYGSGPTYQFVIQGGYANGDCLKLLASNYYVAAGCANELDEVFGFIKINGGPTELQNSKYGLCMDMYATNADIIGAACTGAGASVYISWKLG